LGPILKANAQFTARAVSDLAGTAAGKVESAGESGSYLPPLPADTVEVYTGGAEKFGALLDDVAGAQDYVHLMYLIWKRDELTARITEALLERLKAGVQVRIMYDWLTCLPYPKNELRALAGAGADVVPCYRSIARINYRNHMKIAIIDGRVVYTGGMNMGQEYIDGGKSFAVWRDTHVRMTGPIVAPFISLFATRWILNGRDEDVATTYMPEPTPHSPGKGIPVQMMHSSVATRNKSIRDAFIIALVGARRRVWVQSPYFVPDEPLITAMCVAARAGVDVRFMMTGVPDKRIPFYAAQAYFGQLVEAGVGLYLYTAGFLHAKTVVMDDDLCLIGTCNWDIRSIILHDEVVAAIYDEAITTDHARQFELDLRDSMLVTRAYVQGMSGAVSLRNSVVRLFSRLL
jgi:cardiolipin synthase